MGKFAVEAGGTWRRARDKENDRLLLPYRRFFMFRIQFPIYWIIPYVFSGGIEMVIVPDDDVVITSLPDLLRIAKRMNAFC